MFEIEDADMGHTGNYNEQKITLPEGGDTERQGNTK